MAYHLAKPRLFNTISAGISYLGKSYGCSQNCMVILRLKKKISIGILKGISTMNSEGNGLHIWQWMIRSYSQVQLESVLFTYALS